MSGGQRHQDCARHWELEAARDDRLSEKDLESLRRHLTTCASCKIEQQHLESLGESLRSLPPLPDDVIAARRLRHRLLADVNRSVIGQAPTERRAPRAALASALVALLLLATAVGYRRLGFRASPAPRAAAAPHLPSQSSGDVLVEIAGQPGTQWQRQQLGDELRIQLDSGEIAATIGRHAPEQLVRIQLPDGWIDDLGTVLSVRVEDRRTTSVRVMQGRVRLRLDGRAPVELGAGENWTAAPAAAASVAASAHAPAPSSARARAAAAPAAASGPGAATSSTPAASKPTGGEPTEAVTSAAAAQLAREEDEAYLHIVALARAHQLNEARVAAKDYLLRFPNGFRREEVLGVATQR